MPENTFYTAVESRRTIRDFLPDPVPQDVLDRCLDAARLAPSSSNLQPWEFVVIREPKSRQAANAACLDQLPAKTAPLLIALVNTTGPFGILGPLKRLFSRLASLVKPTPNLMSRGDLRVMAHKSTALAAATFMLAMRAEGYDTCPMEGFDPWRAKALLGLPRGAEVSMFLAVGRRSEQGLWWDRALMPRDWAVREV